MWTLIRCSLVYSRKWKYKCHFYLEKVTGKIFSKKNKIFYFAFVDLEKAFDRVPGNVVWWALRKLGVEE